MSYSVLCVDDNKLVLNTLKLLLESNGYLVTTAATGSDALAHAAMDSFDAAVLDFELPDLRGDSLAQLLNNMQPRLPLILFSGCTEIPRHNTTEFATTLTKGCSMAQLVETVAGIIEANAELVGLE